MHKSLILFLMLMAQDRTIAISATQTGLTDANLADTVVSSSINMDETRATNQLSLTLAVTPGTSLVVVVKCYESQDNSTWGEISFCTSAAAAACSPDERTFTLADYDGTTKVITSRWGITKQYVKCSFDDPADGNGTVTVTGARTWR